MNNKTKKIFVISILSMMMLIAPAASQDPQDDVPGWPMILSGTIEVNNQPAPVGTIIEAFDGTKSIGKYTLVSKGQYGEDLNKLVVNKPTGDIQISIKTPSMSNPVVANEILDWNSNIARLDLSAEFTESSGDQNKRGSGGSISVLNSNTEENNDAVAMPGGNGLDPGLNKLEAQPFQDTTSSSGSDDPSNVNSKSPIIIALLIGIIALIAIFYGRSKNMF